MPFAPLLADVVPLVAVAPPDRAGLAAGLAALGLLAVLGSTTAYFLTIDRERVPEGVRSFQAVLVMGILVGLGGIAAQPGPLPGALFAVTGGLGAFLLYLLGIRKLPDGALTATVGAPLPPLRALDEQGRDFDLQTLLGRRVMVKFFRGSW
jgi:hypothetical protein